MSLVIDSSVALAWCFEDEQSPETSAIEQQVVEYGAIAPVLWPLEIANGLRTAMRRNRITRTIRDAALEKLGNYPIRLDRQTDEHAWTGILRLSDKHDLTPYDGAYLELAIRSNLPLATLDRELLRAALSEGISVFG